MAVDGLGNCYITGMSATNYLTAKINRFGVEATDNWPVTYSGPGAGTDKPRFVLVTLDGLDIFVSGGSQGVGTNLDVATVNYHDQTP